MVRIAYFGTDGCPGHHVIPIRGKFTEEDIKVIESVDCDDFYKVFDVMRFKIAEFKGWTILGIPASLDDHRPGSKTVIFIEGKANEADFMEVIQEYSFLKNKVKKLIELYHDGEWLATGKLNQDPPTNKERFQFTSRMTFEQALEQLKLGRKIKRIDWGKKYICMLIAESDVNILMIDTGQKVASNWNPTKHDIMFNDWEIAG